MTFTFFAPANRLFFAMALLVTLNACSALNPTARPQPSFYSLDSVRSEHPALSTVQSASSPILIVNPTHAASGFDSKHIIYVRQPHQLEYYAHSEWNDTPARMISPLIVATMAKSGAFRAVIPTPSAATGDLRLDSEIIRLQLDTGTSPSHVRFTMRSYVLDNTTREVLMWREFDESIDVKGEGPYGTVIAANRAVQNALEKLAIFCTEAAGLWQSQRIDLK
ncbi:MAG: ABC-type transport auxiliary lipoprotein family protein [Betaproteobacteria bacterium]